MRINLLPKEERGRSKTRVDGLRFAWIGAAALLMLVALVTYFNVQLTVAARTEEADLATRVATVRQQQRQLDELRRENEALAEAKEQMEALLFQNRNEATARLLSDIATAVPEDVWFSALQVNAGRDVFARGHAAETGDLSLLLRNMHDAAGIQSVQLSSLDRVDDRAGHRREFTLNLTVEGWDR